MAAKRDWESKKPKVIIKKEDLAQYLGATQLNDLAFVRTTGKKSLFRNETYEKIFTRKDFEWYVLHMYIGKFTEGIAKNNMPGIATNQHKKAHWWDARWVVMNIFYDRNRELFFNGTFRKKVIEAFIKDDSRFQKSLGRILKKLFYYSNKSFIKNKSKMGGGRKSRNDFFGLKNCKYWTEQILSKRELQSLEKQMMEELNNFWEERPFIRNVA